MTAADLLRSIQGSPSFQVVTQYNTGQLAFRVRLEPLSILSDGFVLLWEETT